MNQNQLRDIFLTGYSIYELIKGRKSGGEVFNHCGLNVNTYLKQENEKVIFDGPGGRVGICGTVKDHKRIYCCQQANSWIQR